MIQEEDIDKVICDNNDNNNDKCEEEEDKHQAEDDNNITTNSIEYMMLYNKYNNNRHSRDVVELDHTQIDSIQSHSHTNYTPAATLNEVNGEKRPRTFIQKILFYQRWLSTLMLVLLVLATVKNKDNRNITIMMNNAKDRLMNHNMRLNQMVEEYNHYNMIGDVENTLQSLYSLLRIAPYDCSARIRIAQILNQNRNSTNIVKAESMYIDALNCERWLNIGYITELLDFYMSLDRYNEAISLYYRAIAMFGFDNDQLRKTRLPNLVKPTPTSPTGHMHGTLD
ncbi:hypothetical protein SAMD00019534_007190, partial [Acytostelium subglobosum LB1]|uniref:hypothetical protein n=1 Tax=Acytostelium subglobosum LB1 TaxID=1410327 RepID=UPI00064514B4